jgi:SAM-dependent methyltransferase
VVIREVSPNDQMVNPKAPEAYYLWGDSVLRCIRLAMDAVGKRDVQSILDFPCGHGRVLRTLKEAFPAASLSACDIATDGVDFCVETFGAEGVYSEDDLSTVDLGGDFDLIWVGSLFTHLPLERWEAFVSFLSRRLAPEGLMVFSTRGPYYAEQIRNGAKPLAGVTHDGDLEMLKGYEETGFGFTKYGSRDDYGLSLSAPWTVAGQLQGLRLVLYLERGWRGYQDIVAVQRGFSTPDL